MGRWGRDIVESGGMWGDAKNESVFKMCCIPCALVPSLMRSSLAISLSLPPFHPPSPFRLLLRPVHHRATNGSSCALLISSTVLSLGLSVGSLQPHFRSVLIPAVPSPLRTRALASSSLAGSFQNGIPPPRLSLPERASVSHSRPASHAPSRKVSKSLSFFPLRDSYGTTQLVVHTPLGCPSLDGDVQQSNDVADLARVPVESTVLIQGHVRLRPEKQRRPVTAHLIPLGSQTTDSPIGLLSRAPLVM